MSALPHGKHRSVCADCGQVKDNIEFQFISKGKPTASQFCRQCRSRQHDGAKATRLKAQTEKSIHDFMALVNASKTIELRDEMLSLFRGIDGFALEWKAVIDKAVRDALSGARSPKVALDAMKSVKELIVQCEQQHDPRGVLDALSDEEIDAVLAQTGHKLRVLETLDEAGDALLNDLPDDSPEDPDDLDALTESA